MNLRISTAPHFHNPVTTQRLMLYVLLALLPSAAFGVYAFGLNALMLLCISCATAVLCEFIWQKAAKVPVRVGDFSALVTGLILGLNLPAGAPWWLAVIGSSFAILLVKQLFGGLGDNFLNPAMAARAVLLASWPVHMTSYLTPTFFESGVDAVTAATPLATRNVELMDLLFGRIPGCIGEVSKVAILIGLLILLLTRTVTWHIPVTMVASVFVFSFLFGLGNEEEPLMAALYAILSGGVLFGAVFMATDYVTTPMTPVGQIIYAAGIGLIVTVIRSFGAYPEGVTYGILLMNIATPLIDRFLPRKIYGHQKEVKKA